MKRNSWEIAEDHFRAWMTKNVSRATQETYLQALRPLQDFFANYKIDKITVPVIERYKNERKGSLATINLSLAVLSRILQVSKDHGYLETVPRVHYLRLEKRQDRVLDPDEVNKIIKNTNDPLRLMVQIAVSTGLTKSLLFNLKWDEIRRGSIDIMKGRKRIHQPLPDQVNKSIAAYKAKQTFKSDYVFPSPHDLKAPRNRSSDLGLGRICDSLGIKGVTFNTFRNTYLNREGHRRKDYHAEEINQSPGIGR
jgi:integrase